MPQLGETVTEGTITRWLKQVGEAVAADEPLFEVSTDKVDSEVPAPAAGTLTEILVPEGETVTVGAKLAVLSEGDGAAGADSSAGEAEPAEIAASSGNKPNASAATSAGSAADEPPAPSEVPPAPAAPPAPPATPSPPSRQEPAPVPAAVAPRSEAAAAGDGGSSGMLMSPVVRRLVREHSLDPSSIQGTGKGGRITRNDVLETARSQPAATAVSTPAAAPAVAAPAPSRARGDQVVPFDNIRRRTAEHMVRSKETSAHVYTSVEVDFERVQRVREAEGPEWKAREGFTLTYLPFIVRAVCDSLDDYPNVNASVDGDQLVVHGEVHLGIAVDLDFQGLLAPIIRDADGKRLRLIAREIRDLAQRARNKQLGPDEILGGTFTITNPGPFDSFMTLPIINQPQVAILSTDGIAKRPVVVEGPDGEDSIAIHHTGVLALAWDHRAFDGAYASSFLRAVKEDIETRDWAAELA
jgi:pyruvate dehydrogenase E2 component (dihydrolipoamide acetyltransferase)